MYLLFFLGGSEETLTGVDFSVRAAEADLGRVVRALLDAGRRGGVPGTGAMVVNVPLSDRCEQCGVCWQAWRVGDLK
jgi:hypothetical protein